MTQKNVALVLNHALLLEAVREQALLLDGVTLTEDPGQASLVVTDQTIATACPQIVIGRAVPGEATTHPVILPLPLRLGTLIDQMRYQWTDRGRLSAKRAPLQLGSYILELDDSQLRDEQGEKTIRLTDKERLFIVTLYDAPGQALDRQTLLRHVWGYASDVETHTLETHLYRLRQKLEGSPLANLIVSEDGLYKLKIEKI